MRLSHFLALLQRSSTSRRFVASATSLRRRCVLPPLALFSSLTTSSRLSRSSALVRSSLRLSLALANDLAGTHRKLKLFSERDKVIELFAGVYGIGTTKAGDYYDSGCRTLEDLDKAPGLPLTEAMELGVKYHEDLAKRIPRDEVTELYRHGGSSLWGERVLTSFLFAAVEAGSSFARWILWAFTDRVSTVQRSVSIRSSSSSAWARIAGASCLPSSRLLPLADVPLQWSRRLRRH